jgi:hypothetical protein
MFRKAQPSEAPTRGEPIKNAALKGGIFDTDAGLEPEAEAEAGLQAPLGDGNAGASV